MKRTSMIRLVRMRKQVRSYPLVPLTAAIGAIMSGCSSDDRVPGYVFINAQDCLRSLPHLAAECESAYETSKQQAATYGPRYRNEDDCEVDFGDGACTTDSTYYYVLDDDRKRITTRTVLHAQPRMDAFVARPLFEGSRTLASEPLLQFRNKGKRGYYTVDGMPVKASTSGRVHDAGAFGSRFLSVSSNTLSRGGFGYKVAAMSQYANSWSSSRSGSGWSWGG
ncbi:putative conserved protein YgiB, involved in bioifilm formation, UPF0441/DUF1190 family [Marinobacter subterrani]|uniref:Putative conserved protein YgiB, involved in bioifilm formation, UPF0441/DUF1190 family n=2 Tax=Marinobacter subterrani TaxID=1658765 RepID=A0A0J7JEK9_9GAMM|nr:putative conserved protein YgiB, involved in bioifilm formation, UPF0441/DUF1190 family [Marinobacter subterrani]